MSAVASRLASVRESLEEAAAQSAHAVPFEIVAVSKRHTVESIAAAAEAGHRDFGENYAVELEEKARALEERDLRWHFIGRLQRNKVAKVIGRASLIHAVDSERLAREISKRAQAAAIEQRVLVAVSLAGEAQKSGVSAQECAGLVELIAELPAIRCEGLMTMPPWPENPEDNRATFARLRELRDHLATVATPLRHLSMGTSGDAEVAVQEGATLVRVGTAIFGPRPQ